MSNDKKSLQLPEKEALLSDALRVYGGSVSDYFNQAMLDQAIRSGFSNFSNEESKLNAQIAIMVALAGIKPKDEMEGMLAAQMVGLHSATMECMRRAMLPDQTFEGRRENLNQANKLSRSYAMLLDTLNRHRGKGQQKVTVEHVHVHAGGQAIVGNITRPEGGGVATKTEEQPHAKQITHAPGQALPGAHAERQLVPVIGDAER